MLLKAPWQWVASPLGFNVLLSKLKENTFNVEKFTQIAKILENTEECKIANKLFISSHSSNDNVKSLISHTDIEDTDFSKNENAFSNFVSKYGDQTCHEFSSKTELILANSVLFDVSKYGDQTCHEFSSKTELILANSVLFDNNNRFTLYYMRLKTSTTPVNCGCTLVHLCLTLGNTGVAYLMCLQSRWQTSGDSGPVMKLYNSFNYTQDVKYEGRLLELPLQSEFKLVLVIPNEDDVLHTLFATLSERGLAAAVNSIQPLFTAKAGLSPPNIHIRSRVEVNQIINGISNGSAVQYGSVSVCDKGTQAGVLTCICSPTSSMVKTELMTNIPEKPPKPFYFAIVFNDTPIFIGDFNTKII